MSTYNRKLLAQALAGGLDTGHLVGRCTGRTTAACLGAIAAAMLNPGKAIVVVDKSIVDSTVTTRKYLADRGNKLVETLGLENTVFVADHQNVKCTSTWAVEL
jgi:outer membrane lipoprotein SlyB